MDTNEKQSASAPEDAYIQQALKEAFEWYKQYVNSRFLSSPRGSSNDSISVHFARYTFANRDLIDDEVLRRPIFGPRIRRAALPPRTSASCCAGNPSIRIL